MSEAVKTFYQSILQQVLALELDKKNLSTQILTTRNKDERYNLIHKFLTIDLKKHELFEHAAIVAMSNHEDAILEQLAMLYAHTGRDDEAIYRIRDEMEFVRGFVNLLDKLISHPELLSFFERRMVQEIGKYVMEQARMYNKSGG